MPESVIRTEILELSEDELARVYSMLLESIEAENGPDIRSDEEVTGHYNENLDLLNEYYTKNVDGKSSAVVPDVDITRQILELMADYSPEFEELILSFIHDCKDDSTVLSIPITDLAMNIIMVSLAISILKPHILLEKGQKKGDEENNTKFEIKVEGTDKVNEIINFIMTFLKK